MIGKHTPGPWILVPSDEDTFPFVMLGRHELCINEPNGSIAETYDANARLIAAAPDMLVLLARAASHIDDLVVDHPQIQSDPLSDEITQFIAKVTQS